MFFVYMLLDPRDYGPRYVGMTINLRSRMYGHVSDCRVLQRPPRKRCLDYQAKQLWTLELRERGLRPLCAVLEIHYKKLDAAAAEVRCWKTLKNAGAKLLGQPRRYAGCRSVRL